MWLRKVLSVAALVAPLALSPVVASAQSRGQDRATEAFTNQSSQGADHAGDNGREVTDLPHGIAKVFASILPPGLARRFLPQTTTTGEPEPEPEPQPEPPPTEPDPTCGTTLVFVGGLPFAQDCNGTLTPL